MLLMRKMRKIEVMMVMMKMMRVRIEIKPQVNYWWRWDIPFEVCVLLYSQQFIHGGLWKNVCTSAGSSMVCLVGELVRSNDHGSSNQCACCDFKSSLRCFSIWPNVERSASNLWNLIGFPEGTACFPPSIKLVVESQNVFCCVTIKHWVTPWYYQACKTTICHVVSISEQPEGGVCVCRTSH